TDGRAYSVATFVDDVPNAKGHYGAARLFVRWSEGGDRPVGHLKTEYLAWGTTPAEALAPVPAPTLQEGKRHLDRSLDAAGAASGALGPSRSPRTWIRSWLWRRCAPPSPTCACSTASSSSPKQTAFRPSSSSTRSSSSGARSRRCGAGSRPPDTRCCRRRSGR